MLLVVFLTSVLTMACRLTGVQPLSPLAVEWHSLPHRITLVSWNIQKQRDARLEHCPNCGGTLTIIAALLDPTVIAQILTHLGLSPRAPPQRPARSGDLLATA